MDTHRPDSAAPRPSAALPRINSQEFPRIETVMSGGMPSDTPPPPRPLPPNTSLAPDTSPTRHHSQIPAAAGAAARAGGGGEGGWGGEGPGSGGHRGSGHGAGEDEGEQAAAGRPVRRWKPRSTRWRRQLEMLAALPDEQVRCVWCVRCVDQLIARFREAGAVCGSAHLHIFIS